MVGGITSFHVLDIDSKLRAYSSRSFFAEAAWVDYPVAAFNFQKTSNSSQSAQWWAGRDLSWMPPQRWDRRYHQFSAKKGQEVTLLAHVGRSVWTCLDPSMQVTSINVKATSAVSSDPRPGVVYKMMPNLSAAQRQIALTTSDAMMASGVGKAALGPYVRGSETVSAPMTFKFGVMVPWILARLHWFMKGPFHAAVGCAVVVFVYLSLDSAGILEAVYIFVQGSIYSGQVALYYFTSTHEWARWAFTSMEKFAVSRNLSTWQVLFGALVTLLGIVCGVKLYLWPESVKPATPSSSTASTPAASGAATPVPEGPSSPTIAPVDSHAVMIGAVGEMMRSQNSFNERLLVELSKLTAQPPLPPPETGPPINQLNLAAESREELRRMVTRLDQFETFIRSDRGQAPAGPSALSTLVGEPAGASSPTPSFGGLPNNNIPGSQSPMTAVVLDLPTGSPGGGEMSLNPEDQNEQNVGGVQSVIDQ